MGNRYLASYLDAKVISVQLDGLLAAKIDIMEHLGRELNQNLWHASSSWSFRCQWGRGHSYYFKCYYGVSWVRIGVVGGNDKDFSR